MCFVQRLNVGQCDHQREGSGRVLPPLDCAECDEVESEWLGAELPGWLGGGSVLGDIQRCR